MEHMWLGGTRTLDGQDFIDWLGGGLDAMHERLYLRARKDGLRSIPDPPRWLEKSLRHDWFEGEVARPGGLTLTRREREVTALCILHGRKPEEVASIMGLSIDTVRWFLKMAKRKMLKYAKSHNLPERLMNHEEA